MISRPTANRLDPGWYVLCYHEVAWWAREHLAGLGIAHPVDLFDRHVSALANAGELVSPLEAQQRVADGDDTPLISFSFDDGYAGVLNHAAPMLDAHGVTGIAAINSTFTDGTDTFWRAKLSWIRACGELPRLAARLAMSPSMLRDATMNHFDDAVLEAIDAVYASAHPQRAAVDRAGLHMSWDDVRSLRDAGWTIANHSANHLPLLEASAIGRLQNEHDACETVLERELGTKTTLWVAPFDRPAHRTESSVAQFVASASGRTVVLVGDRITTSVDLGSQVIHRINAPVVEADTLVGVVRSAARRSQTAPSDRGQ
jgi:peptidoglycan/xylan/chitin deacetylase (PgdA/CDA1 family)